MLHIVVKAKELFDETTNTFITLEKDQPLALEHSLVSISKWEAKYHKPFIPADENEKKTLEELKYYVECMTITQNVNPKTYDALTNEDYKQITDYIADKHTATFFGDELEEDERNAKYKKKKIITSELIYYWMISCHIDIKCEKWHLNNLLTLIKVCQKKNEAQNAATNKKKGYNRDLAQRYAAINAKRMKQSGK